MDDDAFAAVLLEELSKKVVVLPSLSDNNNFNRRDDRDRYPTSNFELAVNLLHTEDGVAYRPH